MAGVLGSRGQIVIEKPIRDALGLAPGYVAVQRLVGDHVELYFYPPEHTASLHGMLADHAQRSVPPEQWAEAREEAWSKALRGEWAADGASR